MEQSATETPACGYAAVQHTVVVLVVVVVSLTQLIKEEEKKKNTALLLTSLVLTMPLTYFPTTESTKKTLDSTARHRSLSPTLTSIFLPLSLRLRLRLRLLSPVLPEACLSLRGGCAQSSCTERTQESERERERGAVRVHAGAGPLQCMWWCWGGGVAECARSRFRSCFLENATRPHIKNALR